MYPARESDDRVLFKPMQECGEGGCHARIWLPKAPIDAQLRVVLMFHGGGFGFGQDSDVPAPEVDYLNEKGVVVVSAQYRLAPHARFAEIVDDLCDAYAWVWSDLIKHVPGAKSIKAVAIEGWSAGAASSCLLGGFYAKRGLPRPCALNVHYGWFDVNAEITSSTPPIPFDMSELLAEPVSTGYPLAEGRALPPSVRIAWLKDAMYHNKLPLTLYPPGSTQPLPPTYNPIQLVSPDFPPTFVMVATKDDLIPVKQSYDFIDKLKEHGVEHAFREADMVHGRSENHPREERETYERWFQEAIRPGLDWVIDRLDKA